VPALLVYWRGSEDGERERHEGRDGTRDLNDSGRAIAPGSVTRPRTLPSPFGLGPHHRRDGRRLQGRRLFSRLEVLHPDIVVFLVNVQLEERKVNG
jgi:hypothetical protein